METNLNKQKFMEFISKAYDIGLTIDIADYSSEVTEDEAKSLAGELSEITGINYQNTKFPSTQAYVLGNVSTRVRGHFFYGPVRNFLEEDVDLSGGEDIAV